MKKIILLTALILFFFSIGTVQATQCGDIIVNDTVLDSDLNCSGNGNALTIGANNIILDCNSHTIQGDGINGLGIYIYGNQYVTIRNCVIQSFHDGIIFYNGNSNTFQDIIVSNNVGRGFIFAGTSYSTFQNIIANNNGISGISGWSSSHNILSSITVNAAGVSGLEFADSINNTFQDITANNNAGRGISIIANYGGSDFNTFQDITANNNSIGIELGTASYNNLFSITANNNSQYGIYLHDYTSNGPSNYNNLQNITANYNGYGFLLIYSANNNFSSITANNNGYGFYIAQSYYNALQGITANNNGYGFFLDTPAFYNTLKDITANYNGYGFYLGSSYNTLEDITSNYNVNASLYLNGLGDNNILQNITANYNGQHGFHLSNSDNNVLQNITANYNGQNGIYLSVLLAWFGSNNNTISSSEFISNNVGVYVTRASVLNTISSSKFISNNIGVSITEASNFNTIFNNYFNNTNNAVDNAGTNYWNKTRTPGTNIIGGPYLGGNFWSDYNGTDTNSDGIGDTYVPYTANGGIAIGGDYLPLVPVNTCGNGICGGVDGVGENCNSCAADCGCQAGGRCVNLIGRNASRYLCVQVRHLNASAITPVEINPVPLPENAPAIEDGIGG